MQLMWSVESEESFTGEPTSTPHPMVINGVGNTLLVSEDSSPADAATALKSLRGFRAASRRIVWCDATQLYDTPNSDMRRWGRRFVEEGGAVVVVVNGPGGHEVAIGAREAGVNLGHAVVCPDWATGHNVLFDLICPGDTLLMLGLSEEACRRLSDRLQTQADYNEPHVSAVA